MDRASSVTVRRATLSDLDAVRRLDRELIRHDRRFDATLIPDWTDSAAAHQWLRERITGRDGIVLIAQEGPSAVGYLVGGRCEAEEYRRTAPMAEVECMFVAPSQRGRGIGERMMRQFLRWCADRGIGRLRVVACAESEGAIAFYRRMGFKPYDLVLERPLRRSRRSPHLSPERGRRDRNRE